MGRHRDNGAVEVGFDPRSRTAAGWSARYAALKSRSVPDGDARAVECRAALSFHRVKRVLDAEVASGHLDQERAATLEGLLHQIHRREISS
jgi:hypothetical protein